MIQEVIAPIHGAPTTNRSPFDASLHCLDSAGPVPSLSDPPCLFRLLATPAVTSRAASGQLERIAIECIGTRPDENQNGFFVWPLK